MVQNSGTLTVKVTQNSYMEVRVHDGQIFLLPYIEFRDVDLLAQYSNTIGKSLFQLYLHYKGYLQQTFENRDDETAMFFLGIALSMMAEHRVQDILHNHI